MAKSIQQILEKILSKIDFEDEPYILTNEEEDRIIAAVIEDKKRHYSWKMKRMAKTEEEIIVAVQKIDWNIDIDRLAVLKHANSIKHSALWEKEQRQKEREELIKKQKEIEEKWTAKKMYHLMSWVSNEEYGKKLIVNDANKHLITALCFFVSRDERFATELNLDKRKGLLIRGPSDVGKTHLVRCIEDNELNPILTLSMIEITDEIKEKGEFEINLVNRRIIYLDDVGTEVATVKHFGTDVLFFKNFIERYYLRNKTFDRLIISTNLNFKQIGEMYGFRVERRMKEMFNVINVNQSFKSVQ